MTLTYFTQDGSYGSAANMVIIDTSEWTEDEWDKIEEAGDYERVEMATHLSQIVSY